MYYAGLWGGIKTENVKHTAAKKSPPKLYSKKNGNLQLLDYFNELYVI